MQSNSLIKYMYINKTYQRFNFYKVVQHFSFLYLALIPTPYASLYKIEKDVSKLWGQGLQSLSVIK